MTCILTVLTVLSVLTNGQWTDIEATTSSRVMANMDEELVTNTVMLTNDIMKKETRMVVCGENVYATTASILAVEENKE